MNILHTSDWHLGQNFFTKSRKDEHQAFLDWLLSVIQAREIDAVIVAGDIFDTGTPPSYARQMYNQFVVELSKLTCTLVVLGGNHDSVSTLNESKQLLACLNTHVIANTSGDINQQVIELNDETGQVGAILCAIPFIRPRDVLQSRSG
ncbi:MAG: exonuclease subunit SbcD, partial [Paraglaciecola chathamensis]